MIRSYEVLSISALLMHVASNQMKDINGLIISGENTKNRYSLLVYEAQNSSDAGNIVNAAKENLYGNHILNVCVGVDVIDLTTVLTVENINTRRISSQNDQFYCDFFKQLYQSLLEIVLSMKVFYSTRGNSNETVMGSSCMQQKFGELLSKIYIFKTYIKIFVNNISFLLNHARDILEQMIVLGGARAILTGSLLDHLLVISTLDYIVR